MAEIVCTCKSGLGAMAEVARDGVVVCRLCGLPTGAVNSEGLEPIAKDMVTTIDSLPGYRVVTVHGVVSLLSDMDSAGVGGGLHGLRQLAAAAGANALIGVSISAAAGAPAMFGDLVGDRFRGLAIGTAVTAERLPDPS